MARYAEEIENMIDVSLHGSQDNLPEESRRTILLYHQVRPRLLQKNTYHLLLIQLSVS